jgi:RNA polymerase sigma-70 factor (ECF subfamily)
VVDRDLQRGIPGTAGEAIGAFDRRLRVAPEAPDIEHEVDDERYVVAAFVTFAPQLRGFALSMVRDADAADDLVQEAFTRLIGEVNAGRRPDSAGAWLHRVCANLVVSGARRATSFRRAIPRMAETGVFASPEDVAVRHDSDARVLLALARLPLDAQAAILLAAEGHDSREIGSMIGRTPLATRAYLCRMRGRLQRTVDA